MSSINAPQMSIQSLNSHVHSGNTGFYIMIVVIFFLLCVTAYGMYDINKKKNVSNDTTNVTTNSTATVVTTGTNISNSSRTGTNISVININPTGTIF